MNDDRVVPALCKAARQADQVTREGMGVNIERLVLDASGSKPSESVLAQRFETAVTEMKSVLETRSAAGREQIRTVLGRVIATYQKTRGAAFLKAARIAVEAVVARMNDETEDGACGLPQ